MNRRARALRTYGSWESLISNSSKRSPEWRHRFEPDGQRYGPRQLVRSLQRKIHKCGRHRVRCLMRLMRLVPIHQEPNTSKKHPQHKIWPYLLRKVVIDRPNQGCCADVSYIRRRRGFRSLLPSDQWRTKARLVAIMNWYRRIRCGRRTRRPA